MPKRTPKVVRYVSPFGSPAWMPLKMAQTLMEHDDKRWSRHQEIKAQTGEYVLGETRRAIGAPRIDTRA